MSDPGKLPASTRRTVLKAVTGAVGLGAAGTANAHEKWNSNEDPGEGADEAPETVGESHRVANVGYHALGSAGTPRSDPRAEAQDPHYGAVTEIRVHGDYAYVGVFSSDAETPGRGLVIVDVGDYTNADSESDLENARPRVVSYVRNNSTATAVMDVKISDDGDYAFLGTQPYTLLFPSDTDHPERNVRAYAEGWGEAAQPFPNLGDHSATASGGGVVVVDVSDPGNPEVIARHDEFSTGIHNLYHHRIGGEDYVFLAKGLGFYSGDTGVYVMRFDRTAHELELVNRWTVEGDDRQGEVGDNSSGFEYCHDVEVHDDPRTGRPTAYVAFLGAGFHICDVSDPADFDHIGQYDMGLSHFTTAPPTLVDGRRVAIVSHEVPDDDGGGYRWETNTDSTGTVFLIDADDIYDHVDPETGEKLAEPEARELEDLDQWTWLSPDDPSVEGDEVQWANFTLSPHNSDLSRHVVETDDGLEEEFWLHQGHYHGGVRFLKLDTDTWSLEERGFSRPAYDPPESSRMEGLNEATPMIWAAVETNGVTLASDINQGVHAMHHERLTVGNGNPTEVSISRADDGSFHTAESVNRVELTVSYPDADVLVRDRLPEGWEVVAGDEHETYRRGGSTFVEFETPAAAGEETTFTYIAERTGGGTTSAVFGPTEISDAGHPARTGGIEEDPSAAADLWTAVGGTIDRDIAGGITTHLPPRVTFGATAGVAGLAAVKRDSVGERLRELLPDREE